MQRRKTNNFIRLISIVAMAGMLATSFAVPIYAEEEVTIGGGTEASESIRTVIDDSRTVPATVVPERANQGASSKETETTKEPNAGLSDLSGEASIGATAAGTPTTFSAGAIASPENASATGAGDETTAVIEQSAQQAAATAQSNSSTNESSQTQTEMTSTTPATQPVVDENAKKEEGTTAIAPGGAITQYITVGTGQEGSVTEQSTNLDVTVIETPINNEETQRQLAILNEEKKKAQEEADRKRNGQFIVTVPKSLDFKSAKKGEPSANEFTVETNFANPKDKLTVEVTRAEGIAENENYNYIMKNRESLFRSAVNGYAFIYTKNDWDNAAKDRADHLAGSQGVSFTDISGKTVFPMVCELVLANDLHAGHWSGTLQFKVTYVPGPLTEEEIAAQKAQEEALKKKEEELKEKLLTEKSTEVTIVDRGTDTNAQDVKPEGTSEGTKAVTDSVESGTVVSPESKTAAGTQVDGSGAAGNLQSSGSSSSNGAQSTGSGSTASNVNMGSSSTESDTSGMVVESKLVDADSSGTTISVNKTTGQ